MGGTIPAKPGGTKGSDAAVSVIATRGFVARLHADRLKCRQPGVTIPTLLYICVTALTVVMCLWAAASALLAEPEHSMTQRTVTGLCAVGLLLMTAAAALGAYFGYPRLAWASMLLPPLTLGVTWSNVVTLRSATRFGQLLAAPILLYDLLLMGVYSVSGLQECVGLDLGTWACAVSSADAHVQALIGHPSALENPVWLRLPIVLPMWTGIHVFQIVAMLGASTCSALLVLLYAMVMPHAFTRTRSYHDANPPRVDRNVSIGVKVPWGTQSIGETQGMRIQLHASYLRATTITFDVDASTFADNALLAQAQAGIAWARKTGLQTVVIARPPARFADIPAGSLSELRREIEHVQWSSAKKLEPDVIVLFTGPFARLAWMTAKSVDVDEWFSAIEKCAREVRDANTKTKVAVAFESTSPSAEKLFLLLKADNSPVDLVGFSIFPGDRMLPAVATDLMRWSRWCRQARGTRPVMVFDCGCGPQINGGEAGQWNFVSRVIAFAGEIGGGSSVSIDGLYDLSRNTGLISWTGKRRLTYRRLERAAKGTGVRPGRL